MAGRLDKFMNFLKLTDEDDYDDDEMYDSYDEKIAKYRHTTLIGKLVHIFKMGIDYLFFFCQIHHYTSIRYEHILPK